MYMYCSTVPSRYRYLYGTSTGSLPVVVYHGSTNRTVRMSFRQSFVIIHDCTVLVPVRGSPISAYHSHKNKTCTVQYILLVETRGTPVYTACIVRNLTSTIPVLVADTGRLLVYLYRTGTCNIPVPVPVRTGTCTRIPVDFICSSVSHQ